MLANTKTNRVPLILLAAPNQGTIKLMAAQMPLTWSLSLGLCLAITAMEVFAPKILA